MSLYQFFCAAFLATLAACGGGGGSASDPDMGDANRAPSHLTVKNVLGVDIVIESVKVAPKINVGPNTHTLEFAIHEGRLWTLEPPKGNPGHGGLLWADVREIRWNSKRSGFGADSVARAVPSADGKVTLPHTPNNDKEGGWTVVAKNGDVWYLRFGQWFQTGTSITKGPDFTVNYGTYREARIDLRIESSQRFVRLHFGANAITGIFPTVFREEIDRFRWNTRNQDWNNPTLGIMSVVKTDAVGDYYVDIGPIPTPTDLGGISAVLSTPKPSGTNIVYLDQYLAGFRVGTGVQMVTDNLGQRFMEVKFPN